MARKKKTAAKKTAVRSVSFDAPQSRNEAILQNILGANNVLEAPQSRNEAILQAILNGTSYTEEPQSRIEELLLCILNGTTTDMVPQSRNEEILIAKINGGSYAKAPQSRIEELLIQWLNAAPAYVEKTVTGNPISITDAIAAEAVALSVATEPIQDLHGYDNPWPAGGGKNKFDSDFADTTINGVSIAKSSDGKLTTSGVPTAPFDFVLGHFSLTAGTYILNGAPANGGTNKWRLQVTDYPVVNSLGQDNGSGVTFTLASDMEIAVRLQMYTGASASLTFAPMIRLASVSDDTFAPYSNICPISGHDEVTVIRTDGNGGNEHSVTVQLGQTVYGGTVDVTTGALTIDRAMVILNGTQSISMNGSTATYTEWVHAPSPAKKPAPSSSQQNYGILSDKLKSTTYTTGPYEVTERATNANIVFTLEPGLDRTAALAWLTANPVQIVYELAEPITATLTPQQLMMLSGENIITSDGEITLTYKAQS